MQTFKTGPTQDQLQSMDRDLQFYPSTIQCPSVLTPAQIESFNTDGYVKGVPIFDAGEIAEHRHHFDQLLAKAMANGGTSRRLRPSAVWRGLRFNAASAHRRLRAGCSGPGGRRARIPVLLPAAPRSRQHFLASGCQPLATDAVKNSDDLARHRRCQHGKFLHALHRRLPSPRSHRLSPE